MLLRSKKSPSSKFCRVRSRRPAVTFSRSINLREAIRRKEARTRTALAGIIIVLHACLDMKSIILGEYHFLLYFLALAIQPRMLMTLDENLEPLSVPVQVGKAVDVVCMSGRPKTITGFQTYLTPVLLAAGDRAELATEKYIPLSPFLEGFVILKENPDYSENH